MSLCEDQIGKKKNYLLKILLLKYRSGVRFLKSFIMCKVPKVVCSLHLKNGL